MKISSTLIINQLLHLLVEVTTYNVGIQDNILRILIVNQSV